MLVPAPAKPLFPAKAEKGEAPPRADEVDLPKGVEGATPDLVHAGRELAGAALGVSGAGAVEVLAMGL